MDLVSQRVCRFAALGLALAAALLFLLALHAGSGEVGADACGDGESQFRSEHRDSSGHLCSGSLHDASENARIHTYVVPQDLRGDFELLNTELVFDARDVVATPSLAPPVVPSVVPSIPQSPASFPEPTPGAPVITGAYRAGETVSADLSRYRVSDASAAHRPAIEYDWGGDDCVTGSSVDCTLRDPLSTNDPVSPGPTVTVTFYSDPAGPVQPAPISPAACAHSVPVPSVPAKLELAGKLCLGSELSVDAELDSVVGYWFDSGFGPTPAYSWEESSSGVAPWAAVEGVTSSSLQLGMSSESSGGTVSLGAFLSDASEVSLALTGHTAAWLYKQTSPSDGTCTPVAADTTAVSLTDLTENTAYTYKAYSDSDCGTEIGSVTFTFKASPIPKDNYVRSKVTFDLPQATTVAPVAPSSDVPLPAFSSGSVKVYPVPGLFTQESMRMPPPIGGYPSAPDGSLYVHVERKSRSDPSLKLSSEDASKAYATVPASALPGRGPLTVAFLHADPHVSWRPAAVSSGLFSRNGFYFGETGADRSALRFWSDSASDAFEICLPVTGDHASPDPGAGTIWAASKSLDAAPVLVELDGASWEIFPSRLQPGGNFICGTVGGSAQFPVLAVAVPLPPPYKFQVNLDLGFSAPVGVEAADRQMLRDSLLPYRFRIRSSQSGADLAAVNPCYVFFRGAFLKSHGASTSGWYRVVSREHCELDHPGYPPVLKSVNDRGLPAPAEPSFPGDFGCYPASHTDDSEVCYLRLSGGFHAAPAPDGPGRVVDPSDPGDGVDIESQCPFAKAAPPRPRPGVPGAVTTIPEEHRLHVRIQPCAGIRAPVISLGDPEHSPYWWQAEGRSGWEILVVDEMKVPGVYVPPFTPTPIPAIGFGSLDTTNALRVVSPASSARGTESVELRFHFEAELGDSGRLVLDFGDVASFGAAPTGDPEAAFILPDAFSSEDIVLETWIPPGAGPDTGPEILSFPSSRVSVDADRRYLTVTLPSGFGSESGASSDAWHTLVIRRGLPSGDARRVHNSRESGFKRVHLEYRDDGVTSHREFVSYVYRVDPSLTVFPLHGPRGTGFSLTGKSFPDGRVRFYPAETAGAVDQCRRVPGSEQLGDVLADRYGMFETDLDSGGSPGSGDFLFVAEDVLGGNYCAVFKVDPEIKVSPLSIAIGGEFTLRPFDLDLGAVLLYDPVSGSRLLVDCLGTSRYRTPGEDGSYRFAVPSGAVPGRAYVEAYDKAKVDTSGVHGCVKEGLRSGVPVDPDARVEVEVLPIGLTVAPVSAVPGQRLNISGSGFSQSPSGQPDIRSLRIGGEDVPIPQGQGSVDSLGFFSLSVDNPAAMSAKLGESVRVRVVSHSGVPAEGRLDIPSPSFEVDPDEGRLGTQVDIEYSGFFSNRLVIFQFGQGCGGQGVSGSDALMGSEHSGSDGSGSISLRLPLSFPEGSSPTDLRVYAESRGGPEPGICAGAAHAVPDPVISVFPLVAAPGGRLTVRGENFVPHTGIDRVFIGGVESALYGNRSADSGGAFEFMVSVPGVDPGRHPVRVVQGGEFAAWTVTIVRPGPRGSPDEVFSEFAGVVSVWKLQPDGVWLYWFPDLRDADGRNISTLTSLNGADGVWVQLSGGGTYAGVSYDAGWHFIYVL